jgi:hypothetical protein
MPEPSVLEKEAGLHKHSHEEKQATRLQAGRSKLQGPHNMKICLCLHIYSHGCMHFRARTHTHVRAHTHTHTHTHSLEGQPQVSVVTLERQEEDSHSFTSHTPRELESLNFLVVFFCFVFCGTGA